MSNAAARVAPSSAWRSTAVDGSRRSGVAVLSTIDVELAGADTPARSIALARRVGGHGRSSSPSARDVALVNAGALDDPLVGRLDADRREVVVRHDASRERRGPCRRCTRPVASRLRSPRRLPRRRPMCSFMLARRPRCTRDLDRVLDRARRRLAVRDDAHAVHAEQRRAAVLGVVELLESLPSGRPLVDARLGEEADDDAARSPRRT